MIGPVKEAYQTSETDRLQKQNCRYLIRVSIVVWDRSRCEAQLRMRSIHSIQNDRYRRDR